MRGITIEPATGREILLTREPPRPWMATIDESTQEANEENLFSLLKAVTTTRAIGFESDAATDFSSWGLDRPVLKLRFLAADNQALELRFGLDAEGRTFVNRLGTPTVMRIDPSLLAAIAVRPYEWRLSRLWSVDRFNLTAIERTMGDEVPLLLKYADGPGTWEASRAGENLSDKLDPTRANFMLGVLEGLKVSRWLATDDDAALTALLTPSLSFTVIEKLFDDNFTLSGISTRKVSLAPAAGPNPGFYYGRLNNEPHPFLLDSETYRKLAVELFEP